MEIQRENVALMVETTRATICDFIKKSFSNIIYFTLMFMSCLYIAVSVVLHCTDRKLQVVQSNPITEMTINISFILSIDNTTCI